MDSGVMSVSSPLSCIDSDAMMLDGSDDQVKPELLATWMENVPFLAPMIDCFIPTHGAEANKYVETLQAWLRQSPVRFDFSRRKSQADMQTLWSKLNQKIT